MIIVVYQDRNLTDKKIIDATSSVLKGLNKKYNKIHEIIYVEFNNFKLIKCDYAIIWNVFCKFKQNTLYRKKVEEFQKKNNDKLIVIENGFINRENYISIGYDHISNFGNYPKFPYNEDRLKKLDLQIKNMSYNTNINKNILFCTQLPWDTQVQDVDYSKWIIDTINILKKHTKRQIVIRKHPKSRPKNGFDYFDNYFFKKNNLDVIISDKSIEDDFKDSYCVIAFNSTILVDAVINGIPVLSGSETSIVNDICIKDISTVENLHKFSNEDIKKCLSLVAYKQWNLDEISQGIPFDYYI